MLYRPTVRSSMSCQKNPSHWYLLNRLQRESRHVFTQCQLNGSKTLKHIYYLKIFHTFKHINTHTHIYIYTPLDWRGSNLGERRFHHDHDLQICWRAVARWEIPHWATAIGVAVRASPETMEFTLKCARGKEVISRTAPFRLQFALPSLCHLTTAGSISWHWGSEISGLCAQLRVGVGQKGTMMRPLQLKIGCVDLL